MSPAESFVKRHAGPHADAGVQRRRRRMEPSV
jgi:hypothetical protein